MANSNTLLKALSLIFFLSAALASAQSNNANVGLPPNGTFEGSGIESVQVTNGNLHIEIPFFTLPGRGLPVQVSYVYDSKGWFGFLPGIDSAYQIRPGCCQQQWAIAGPLSNGTGLSAGKAGASFKCTSGTQFNWVYTYQEPSGASHNSFGVWSGGLCRANNYTGNLVYSYDGTGHAFSPAATAPTAVTFKNGTRIYSTGSGTSTKYIMEDANGNQITKFPTTANTITDTLGRSVGIALTLNSSTGKYEIPYFDSTGTQQKIIVTKSPVSIQTHLCPIWGTFSGGIGCTTEYSATGSSAWQMPTEIDLPNGMKYTIAYNQNSYGTPSSITLPTGATISYTWGTTAAICGAAGSTFDTDEAGPRLTSRTVTINGVSSTWNYTYVCGSSTNGVNQTVVSAPPDGNGVRHDTVHQFAHYSNPTVIPNGAPYPGYEIETDYYSGPRANNVIVKTVQTTYQTAYIGDYRPITETTTWNSQGNLQSRVETDWDYIPDPSGLGGDTTWSNPVEKREYGFGAGAYGTLARRTHFNYAHLSGNTNYNVNYLNLNIADLVTEKQVYDGGSPGTLYSDAKMYYDQATPSTTSSVPNHDYSIGTTRGNLTQTSQWLNTTNTWSINTTNAYNDLGHVTSTTDPVGHVTNFSYADSWSGATCSVGTNTQAYLTQTQAPDTVNQQGNTVHHRSQTTYFPCTGQKQSTRDENDILATRTGTSYTYDSMMRPLTVTHTDGGQTSYSYNDTANSVSVTTTEKIDNSGNNIVSTVLVDGLGRHKQGQLTSDPEGTVLADSGYDLLGRKATVSNPYRTGSEPTAGTTSYQYDALDRVVLEVPPDGSSTGTNNVQTSYSAQTSGVLGLTTTVTDQAGKKRMSVTDALGHIADVWEPDASTGSLVNETAYTYDPLNDLLSVTQKGNASSSLWRTRTFTYDSLSRLLTATNPESGLIQWTYDNDSNVLTKKDARNITITYNYDQLHRVATVGTTPAKTYSNADHQVDYFFDQTSYNGLTIAEGVNQRTGMSDATGQTAWTFDSEGRTLKEQRTFNISGVTSSAITKSLQYTYNLDGSLASLTYPTGHVVNYSYNNAGRTTSVVNPNGGSPITYLSWDCPKTGVYCYSPHGEELRLFHGTTVFTNHAYNSRLQPSQFIARTSTSTQFSLSFNFNLGVNDNGTLARIVNNATPGQSRTYTYDQLNRIVSAANDSTAGDTSNWGNMYAIDAWGNLYQKNSCNGTVCPAKTFSDSLTVSVSNNKNQFDAYAYDANGNLTNDQLGHTFTYDAENRPYSGGGANYYYDGEGERVAKSNGMLYWFGTNSAPVLETDLTGLAVNEYIFANGQRWAMRHNGSFFYFTDQVGSAQVVVADSGSLQQAIEYHPYGEERVISNFLGNNYRFTGKEHDSETNDDYFGARYYGSWSARFLTPDWAATPAPVPYADLGNPQTLNLYSYVENNPITGTDPDGHVIGVDDLVVLGIVGGVALYTYTASPAGQEVIRNGINALANTPNVVSGWFKSDNNAENNTPPPSENSSKSPRTTEDELPRDENGRPVVDAEAAGTAHTQLGTRQSKSKPGTSYPQSREFDENGKPVKDIDHTDHGRPDKHTDPHQHPYDPSTGKRLPSEPVNPVPPPTPAPKIQPDAPADKPLPPPGETNDKPR